MEEVKDLQNATFRELDGPNSSQITEQVNSKENEELQEQEPVSETKTEDIQEPVQEPVQEEVKEEPSEEMEIVNVSNESDIVEVVNTTEESQTNQNYTVPENLEKLVEFMNETGGTLEDYVSLNKDYDKLNDTELIREYYRQKSPHLSDERIDRKINKNFSYDEDEDELGDIQDKKDSFEDELYEAKKFLQGNKEKYYADVVKRSGVSQEQLQRDEQIQKVSEHFQKETDQLFSEQFEGFDFHLGGNKAIRYKVNNANSVKEMQQNVDNVLGGFLDENGYVKDAAQYHKAMFAALNADKLAQLAYEQGKADAIKDRTKESKNIDLTGKSETSSQSETLRAGQFREINNPSGDGRQRIKWTPPQS